MKLSLFSIALFITHSSYLFLSICFFDYLAFMNLFSLCLSVCIFYSLTSKKIDIIPFSVLVCGSNILHTNEEKRVEASTEEGLNPWLSVHIWIIFGS